MSTSSPAVVAPSVPATPSALAAAPSTAKVTLDTSHANLTSAEKKAWTSKQIMIAMTSVLLLIIVVLSILGLTTRALYTERLGQREKDEVAKSPVFDGMNIVFWTCIVLALIAIAIMYVFATGKITFPDGKAV